MLNDNLIIIHNSTGESSLYWVDDETFNELFHIYGFQKDYDQMMEAFWEVFEKHRQNKNFEYTLAQWNSCDLLKKPRITKRILTVM